MSEPEVRDAIDRVLRSGTFLLHPDALLQFGSGKIILDGRLIVSIELNRSDSRVYVTRHIAMRSATQPVLTETVGTIDGDSSDIENLLARCTESALAGTSRLAIASHETGMPAFLLGRIAFASDEPRRIEFFLRSNRSPQEIDSLANELRGRPDVSELFRRLFNRLALSPYTCLIDNLIHLITKIGDDFAIDTIGYMLRHLVRHMTAFDLIRFHNAGANYPDALMLDALLAAYVELAGSNPEKFRESKIRRRALRQGWIVRRQYEGHEVPDSPTSPGDEQRVWPVAMAVSSKRNRRLYVDRSSESLLVDIRDVWRMCVEDLDDPLERHELGMATFLDRPLGVLKRSKEVDRTPLVSYEAFSKRIAVERLKSFGRDDVIEVVAGVAVGRLAGHSREGVIALENAKKAALDFVFTRTTRSSLDDLLGCYRWPDDPVIDWLKTSKHVLLIRTPGLNPSRPLLTTYDESMTLRLEITPAENSSPRYVEHAGVEYLAEGLLVRIGDEWKSAPAAI